MRLTGTCVLVLGVFAFAVPAYAGNGNGNGNGKGNAGAGEAAPGNSADAPGQEKKDDATAVPAATTTTTTAAATTTTTSAAPTEGVKPSNETAHETHAQAQSNDTKLYGNGQNAGEIAIGHGASGNTVLHGPGNSQPHKAAPCSGGHERDVHALKGRHSSSCGGSDPVPNPTPKTPPHANDPPAVVTTETEKPAAVDPIQPAPPQQPNDGGDAAAEEASHSSHHGGAQGVLSATERVGRAASLPFTGEKLWIVVLAGLMLIAVGFALRQIRTVEALVESGHDHTDRSRHAAHSSRSSVGGGSGR
jgi:hypothetical protein